MAGNVHKNPFIIICIYAFAGIMGAKYLLSLDQAIITTFLFICFAIFYRLRNRTPVSNFFLLLALRGQVYIYSPPILWILLSINHPFLFQSIKNTGKAACFQTHKWCNFSSLRTFIGFDVEQNIPLCHRCIKFCRLLVVHS